MPETPVHEDGAPQSTYFWVKAITRLVNNHPIRENRYRNNVFLHSHCVIEGSFAIQELLETKNQIICDFPLCLQLGVKNKVTIIHTNYRHWPLADCVDKNAKAILRFLRNSMAHNATNTWPGCFAAASYSFFQTYISGSR